MILRQRGNCGEHSMSCSDIHIMYRICSGRQLTGKNDGNKRFLNLLITRLYSKFLLLKSSLRKVIVLTGNFYTYCRVCGDSYLKIVKV